MVPNGFHGAPVRTLLVGLGFLLSMNEKKRSPAFQFYADDFLSGTMTMTNEERGAYIALLCVQWSKGHVSQMDFDRMTLAMPSHSQAICQEKFQKDADGLMRNARLEMERQKQASYRKKQSEIANIRWHGNANAYATEMPRHMPEACSPSPSPSPINTKNTDPELESFRIRIGSWFRRRPTTQWTDRELKALKSVHKLETPTEDLDLLERWYTSGDPYLRRDPITLLNNWNGEIDRARNNVGKPQLFQKQAPDTSKYTKEQIMLMEAMG